MYSHPEAGFAIQRNFRWDSRFFFLQFSLFVSSKNRKKCKRGSNVSFPDLSALSCLPHLLELDVSHNHLRQLLDFSPPKNLKAADFSFNQIEEIGDLSEHHYLNKLIVDNNQISRVIQIKSEKVGHGDIFWRNEKRNLLGENLRAA